MQAIPVYILRAKMYYYFGLLYRQLDNDELALQNFVACVNEGNSYDAKVRKEALNEMRQILNENIHPELIPVVK